MKQKSKNKKFTPEKWIMLLAAALFFVCNCSVMWAEVQEHFFENSINDSLSAAVMSSQVVITDPKTTMADEKTEDSKDKSSEEAAFRTDDWRLILVNKQHPIPDEYKLKRGSF